MRAAGEQSAIKVELKCWKGQWNRVAKLKEHDHGQGTKNIGNAWAVGRRLVTWLLLDCFGSGVKGLLFGLQKIWSPKKLPWTPGASRPSASGLKSTKMQISWICRMPAAMHRTSPRQCSDEASRSEIWSHWWVMSPKVPSHGQFRASWSWSKIMCHSEMFIWWWSLLRHMACSSKVVSCQPFGHPTAMQLEMQFVT